MRLRRLAVMGLCVISVFALTAAVAQASPEWWVRHTGAPTGESLSVKETLGNEGEITVLRPPEKPFKCLVKGDEEVFNLFAIGHGEGTVMEGLCEKGAPYPCAPFELSEFVSITPNWTSELVKVGTKIFNKFGTTEIEWKCLTFSGHAVYKQVTPLQPEVGIGKLKFKGAPSGELEISPTIPAVPHLSFKGTYYTAPETSTYKAIRAK
jgi:hypothetical protein